MYNDCQTHPTGINQQPNLAVAITLDSGIDVGPAFIIFFPGPMDLLKALRFLIFRIFSWPYGYFQVRSFMFLFLQHKFAHLSMVTQPKSSFYQLRPYIYPFCLIFQAICLLFLPNFLVPLCQIFQALCLFPSLRLFRSLE